MHLKALQLNLRAFKMLFIANDDIIVVQIVNT